MAGLSGNEYAAIRARMNDYIDHVEHQRDGAKAAAKAYPSTAATKLGEADAYDDVVADLRRIIAHWPE